MGNMKKFWVDGTPFTCPEDTKWIEDNIMSRYDIPFNEVVELLQGIPPKKIASLDRYEKEMYLRDQLEIVRLLEGRFRLFKGELAFQQETILERLGLLLEDEPTDALRYNEGKVDYTRIPVDALTEEAAVWAAGAVKYGELNWEKLWGENTIKVVTASILRHTYAILQGEVVDKESGCLHAAHLRANAAMLIRYQKEEENEHYNNK